MKNKTILLTALLAGLLTVTTGCLGPYYTSRDQYDKGRWKGLADNQDIRRMNRDQLATESQRMALEKLRAAPVQMLVTNGVPQGFRGCVWNRSSYRDANIIIDGPEKRGIYITHGDKRYYWLIPGTYTATIFDENGDMRGQPRVFHVNTQTHDIGEEVSWYIIAPP